MSGDRAIDLSERCGREIQGAYVNVFAMLSDEEASELANSDGFGVRIRASSEAPLFLGTAPMAIKGAEDLIRSFVVSLTRG